MGTGLALREARDRLRLDEVEGCVKVGFDGEGVWGPVEGGVYVVGVETVELDNVTVEAFRVVLEVDGVVTSVLNGMSCKNAFVCVWDAWMLTLCCCSLVKSVPPI
jgi:hypothetical protein